MIVSVLAYIFKELLFISLTATAIGMFVLLLRPVLSKYISPKWQRLLWVFVLIAFLIPLRPESSTALTSIAEPVRQLSFREDYATAAAIYVNELDIRTEAFAETETGRAHNKLYIIHIIVDIALPVLWISGVGVVAFYYLLRYIKLKRFIQEGTKLCKSERIENILDVCKTKLDISREIRIAIEGNIHSPAIIGLFKPIIVLPEYVTDMDDQSVLHILLHEVAHCKRKDLAVNFLIPLILALHWFNPFLRLLIKYIREDIELANDVYTVSVIGAQRCAEYSYTLLEVLERSAGFAVDKRFIGMASCTNAEKRINTIMRVGVFNKTKVFAAILSFILTFALCITFMTAQVATELDDLNGSWITRVERGSNEHSATEIFTFYPDGQLSVTSTYNFIQHRLHSGVYSTDYQADRLHLEFNKTGSTCILPTEVSPIFSISEDKQKMFLTQHGITAEYERTTTPSISQLIGVWKGRQSDGSEIIFEFDRDSMLYITTKSGDFVSDYQSGIFLLSETQIELIINRDVYINSRKINFLLSFCGTNLLLPDYGNTELLELHRAG